MRLGSTFCIFLCAFSAILRAEPNSADMYVRVVDVGAGLCCVARIPGDHYLVYDAGNYGDKGKTAFAAIEEIIPETEEIDLLVLSHIDADHLAAVPKICETYKVAQILHSGYITPGELTTTYSSALAAIESEQTEDGAEILSLAEQNVSSGKVFDLMPAKATFVFGLEKPPAAWGFDESGGEFRNAGSIVIRLTYAGKSILFCGDSVGRHIGDPDDACIAAESVMVENADKIAIDSDVVIAPHHGADNGSSSKFIKATSPEYVIFSAGSKFDHPRMATAQRYLNAGVDKAKIFRTDLGDDESAKNDDEWDHGRVANTKDTQGDDDVEITIAADGAISVGYRKTN